MSENVAQQFAAALQQTEQSGDVEAVSRMFADDALLASPEREVEKEGPDAIRDFWRGYLNSFDRIHSEFRTIRESDGLCVLEWESKAAWKNGREAKYRGASVLEVKDGRVHRFATYYDTAALQNPVASES